MLIVSIFAVCVLVGLPLYGIRGGSGALLFSGLLVLLFGLFVKLLSSPIAGLFPHQPATAGWVQIAIFLLLCCAAIPLGVLMNQFVQMSIDPFDWSLGAFFGLATGVVALHFFLIFLLTVYQGTPLQAEIAQTFFVRNFVNFEGWHSFSNYMANLGSDRKTLPHVD